MKIANIFKHSQAATYAACHLLILVGVTIETVISVTLVPLFGWLIAGIGIVVYAGWLFWRMICLVKNPSKELRYFDKDIHPPKQ